MTYTVEKLPNEPITIFTMFAVFDWGQEAITATNEVIEFWNASDEPVYHIVDGLHYRFANMDELMTGMAMIAFGESPMWAHPKLKLGFIVTQNPRIVSAVENMTTAAKTGGIYKRVPMMTIGSQEEALDYIREQIRMQKSAQ